MQWGDLSFTSQPVSDFLSSAVPTKTLTAAFKRFFNFASSPSFRKHSAQEESSEHGIHAHDKYIDSRKAKISALLHAYTQSPSTESFEKLNEEMHND